MAAGAPRPIGFRASTFTLTRATWWAFDVLVARGYRYDSSVHPVRHPVYGVPDFEPGISRGRGRGRRDPRVPGRRRCRSSAATCRWGAAATSACCRGP